MRRISLSGWILLAMVAGGLFGWLRPDVALSLGVISNIFLRLIRSIIAPVLFGVLIRALAESGGSKELGRLGWRSVVYFEVVTSLALITGWVTCLIVQPGVGIIVRQADGTAAAVSATTQAPAIAEVLTQMFPQSIVDAMARGDVLQITIFCLIFGLACAALSPKQRAPVVRFAGAAADIAFKYTSYIMYLAPLAVFSAMAVTIAENGSASALGGIAKFVLAAWGLRCSSARRCRWGACGSPESPSPPLSGRFASHFWWRSRPPQARPPCPRRWMLCGG